MAAQEHVRTVFPKPFIGRQHANFKINPTVSAELRDTMPSLFTSEDEVAGQNEINGEIFNRINSLETSVSEMKGMLSSSLQQNEKLLGVISFAMKALLGLILILLFALIYGAIGKDGLHAVRDASKPIHASFAIPWNDSLKAIKRIT